ncbi:MAG: hypothetical protein KGP02_11410 [Burkholderiales bacterium]|jgi:hypothetical protein|nr:hypothetical protein [Burkholderiales bacterium]
MSTPIHVAQTTQADRLLATTLLAFCTDPFVSWALPLQADVQIVRAMEQLGNT